MNLEEYNFYLEKLKNIDYSTQDHWDIFSSKYYDKISDFDCMKSFRTNGISNMLETALPSQDREPLIENNGSYDIDYSAYEIEEIKKRFSELKIMMGDDISKIEFNSAVGNPRRLKQEYDGKECLLNFDDLYHAYAAWQLERFICNLFDTSQVKNILEIGAGYGNLAHKIKIIFKKSKYIIIDLPEVLLIQHYYLSKNNPSYKIVNLLDTNNVNTNVDKIDCDILLVPFHLYKNYQFNFDVVINNRSFGEMPKETLTDYIDWIQKNISLNGILYTVNRYVFTKSLDKNKIRDYPFDNFWNVIISQPQWLQTHLHEFILQRTSHEPNISLEFLLKSFPISTPPPGPIMQKIQTQAEWLRHQNIK